VVLVALDDRDRPGHRLDPRRARGDHRRKRRSATFAVDAEQRSLEEIATPITAEDAE